MSRLITIVLDIEDQKQANWIWDAYRDRTLILGSKVMLIADGNATVPEPVFEEEDMSDYENEGSEDRRRQLREMAEERRELKKELKELKSRQG